MSEEALAVVIHIIRTFLHTEGSLPSKLPEEGLCQFPERYLTLLTRLVCLKKKKFGSKDSGPSHYHANQAVLLDVDIQRLAARGRGNITPKTLSYIEMAPPPQQTAPEHHDCVA